MKLALVVITLAVFLAACGETRTANGTYCPTCGLFSDSDCKAPGIRYEVSPGNIFWGCVLFETGFAPTYLFGFSMFNPVAPKVVRNGAGK